MERTEILIIGAGAAGLAAAEKLVAAGRKVLVLEARPRVGGRVLDISPPLVALGAEFLHGPAKHTRRLMKKAGLKLSSVRPAFALRREGQWGLQKKFWDYLAEGFEKVPARADQSFLKALKGAALSPKTAEDLLAFVTGFHAARPDWVSAAAVAADDDGESYNLRRIEGGYSKLIRHMKKKIRRVKLGYRVTRVNWKEEDVLVTAKRFGETHKFLAKKVLVTVPLGLLQREDIRFKPKLREKKKALRHLAVGPVHRYVLQFKKPFWDTKMNFFQDARAEIPTWWTVPYHSHLLVGWAGGPKADKLKKLTQRAEKHTCLRTLSKLFNLQEAALGKNLLRFWTHDWQQDVYAKGAYSYARVNGMEAAEELSKPLRDRLYFAGEATDFSGANGTVEGAIASGYREAEKILKSLKA